MSHIISNNVENYLKKVIIGLFGDTVDKDIQLAIMRLNNHINENYRSRKEFADKHGLSASSLSDWLNLKHEPPFSLLRVIIKEGINIRKLLN